MLALAALTLKKTITLIALVGPFSMIPIFLSSVRGLDYSGKARFALTIGVSVTAALFIATFLGMPLLGLLGVSLGAMQVGGGIIVLLLAIAMVLGKETDFKGSSDIETKTGPRQTAVVPLAVPLLAGPAAFSYVMANSAWDSIPDLFHVVVPIMAAGLSCWLTFRIASHPGSTIHQSKLDLIERVGGFILAAMAVEMMATGLRSLFPLLTPR
ncbi:MAG: MarC family protein [Betaproteobacteria bacterium]|nr:MarC family protein [Betaproteobacteria bacterium]